MLDTAASPAIRQELERLRKTYVRRLVGSVGELRRMQVMLASPVQVPLSDLQHLYKLSNDLAGSGATYGFPKISQTAQALHESLRGYINSDLQHEGATGLRRDALYKLDVFQSACMDVLQPKAGGGAEDPLRGKKALVISQDETLASFITHILQQAGLDAFADSAGKPADLVVCDTVDAVKTVRAQDSQLPVILVLEKGGAAHIGAAHGLVDDLLVKPFTPDLLLAVIGNRLQRGKQN